MSDYASLELEDRFFEGTSIEFAQTPSDYLMISINDNGSYGIITLTEDDVDRIRKFLKNWDD